MMMMMMRNETVPLNVKTADTKEKSLPFIQSTVPPLRTILAGFSVSQDVRKSG